MPLVCDVAERAGFELAIPCGMLAFQASALGHYATSPRPMRIITEERMDGKKADG